MARVLLKHFKHFSGKQFVRNVTLPTIQTTKKFRITMVQPESYESILNFMIKNFAKDPLSYSLGANNSSEFGDLIKCAWSEELKKGFSLQAISTETNQVVGVSINSDPNDKLDNTKRNEFLLQSNCDATRNLLEAWGIIERLSVLIPFYNEPNGVFEISGLAVDENYTGMGISKMLIVQSLCMAKCHGFKVAKIDCTSEFSARAAQALGFQCIYEKPFEHFNGIKKIQKPHTHAKVFARLLGGFLL